MSIPIKLPRLAIAENVYQDRLALDREKNFWLGYGNKSDKKWQ